MSKRTLISLSLLALTLTACGSDTKETIIHEHPVVIQQPANNASPSNVERDCEHGYDNRTHQCY